MRFEAFFTGNGTNAVHHAHYFTLKATTVCQFQTCIAYNKVRNVFIIDEKFGSFPIQQDLCRKSVISRRMKCKVNSRLSSHL